MSADESTPPIYRFNRRLLCPLERKHLSKLKEWRNQQIDILRQRKPLTEYHQEKWYPKAMNDENQMLFSIQLEESDTNREFIGYCGIVYIDYVNRRGEISFLVSPKRLSDRDLYRIDFLSVLYLVCEFVFGELGLNKLYTETFAFRKTHIDVLEEFGFVLEGRLRDHHFSRGQYNDSLLHSFLLSEWNKQKDEIKNAVEE